MSCKTKVPIDTNSEVWRWCNLTNSQALSKEGIHCFGVHDEQLELDILVLNATSLPDCLLAGLLL